MDSRLDSHENSCTVSQDGVVQLVGEHDIASATDLDATIARAARLSAGTVVVDLTRTTFVDSSVVAVVVRRARDLVGSGRSVVVRVTEGSTPAAVIGIVGLADQPGVSLQVSPASP